MKQENLRKNSDQFDVMSITKSDLLKFPNNSSRNIFMGETYVVEI